MKIKEKIRNSKIVEIILKLNNLQTEKHYLNMRNFIYIPNIIKLFKPYVKENDKVVDIGIGKGEILQSLVQEFKIEPFGIDREIFKINESSKLGMKNLYTGDAHNLPFENNHFDISFSHHTIHVLNTKQAVCEMERVTKPGGYIIICFANQTNFSNKFYWYGYNWRKIDYPNKVNIDILKNYFNESDLIMTKNTKYFNIYSILSKTIKINFIFPPLLFDYLSKITTMFLTNEKHIVSHYVIFKKNKC
jgi:ubiquinone/menaquinone biosynthesis C-methylase UbiE